MTRNQHLYLICRTLLLPFRNPAFGSNDPLLNKSRTYLRFLTMNGQEHKLYKIYVKQRDQIIQSLYTEGAPDNLDNIQQALNLFYDDTTLCERLNAQAGNSHSQYPLDAFYINRILEISDSFVTLRNGHPALRTWTNRSRKDLFDAYGNLHKAELWNMLARLSTPDLWIAGYYVNSGLNDLGDLQNIMDDLQLADHVLLQRLDKGLAETHLHFNAGMNYQMLWELVSDVTALQHQHSMREKYKDILDTLLKAGLLRLYLADYLVEPQSEMDFYDYCKRRMPPAYDEDVLHPRFSQQQSQAELPLTSGMLSPAGIIYMVLTEACCGAADAPWCNAYFEQFSSCTQYLMDTMNIKPFEWRFDLLSRSVYADKYSLNTSCDLILFHQALPVAKQNNRPQFRHALLQYIRLKNHFFKQNTQAEDVHGLRTFHGYYGRAAGSPYIRQYDAASRNKLTRAVNYAIFRSQSRLTNLRRFEFKIVPPITQKSISVSDSAANIQLKVRIARQLWNIFSAYLQFIEQTIEENAYEGETEQEVLERLTTMRLLSFPTPGVIYHFIKPDLLRSSFGQVCWVMEQADKAQSPNYVETLRKKYMNFCDVLTKMLQEIPYLGDYVVGLDAASEELNAEPWLYAPVFTYARRRHNTYPTQLDTRKPIPTLGLTYHIGEDFRHLMSGLRVIDEVLDHFGFKSGDRLGHSIALQVDPNAWSDQHCIVALPIVEHFENLLWLWGLKNQGETMQDIPDLDLKIMQLAEKLYGTIHGITPYVLWKAYQKKFLNFNAEDVFRNSRTCQTCPWHTCSADNSVPRNEVCPLIDVHNVCIWSDQQILSTHFCPHFTARYRHPIFVPVTKNEVILMGQLQTILKDKIGQRGITIEVNPTSNASIGEIGGIFQHPLFKLNNRGLERPGDTPQHLSITINSDDPLVFHTMIENEISYIYYMLTNKGYSREDVLDWIDQIRQFGLNSSFIQHEKQPIILLRELREMCRRLQSDYLKEG